MRRIKLWWHWTACHVACRKLPSIREFRRIMAMYRNGRYYHNDVHILDTLDFVDAHYSHLNVNKAAIKFALFYHDVIYKIGSKTNEADSAIEWMMYGTKLGFDKTGHFVNQVAEMINRTAHHKADLLDSEEIRIVLDSDMSILFKDIRDYHDYAMNIAREYLTIYTTEQYVQGRIGFLERTLDDLEFYTGFGNSNRDIAIQNMKFELIQLQNGNLLRDVKYIASESN